MNKALFSVFSSYGKISQKNECTDEEWVYGWRWCMCMRIRMVNAVRLFLCIFILCKNEDIIIFVSLPLHINTVLMHCHQGSPLTLTMRIKHFYSTLLLFTYWEMADEDGITWVRYSEMEEVVVVDSFFLGNGSWYGGIDQTLGHFYSSLHYICKIPNQTIYSSTLHPD